MKLRTSAYKRLGEVICGDKGSSIYLSGPKLVQFFNELGLNEVYEQGFPTRYIYAQEKAKYLIENGKFVPLLNALLDGTRFLDSTTKPEDIVRYLNEFLCFEGYEVQKSGLNKYVIVGLHGHSIAVTVEQLNAVSTDFLIDQVGKCHKKISECDYYGAITNARSMVEEVLLAIEERITGCRGPNTGDIGALYKRVGKLVNFDAGQDGIGTPLKQILSGLNNIVIGLGALRTKASDSHAPEYKPEKHHAVLAVNSANTFTAFIIESYQYQLKRKDN